MKAYTNSNLEVDAVLAYAIGNMVARIVEDSMPSIENDDEFLEAFIPRAKAEFKRHGYHRFAEIYYTDEWFALYELGDGIQTLCQKVSA